jgi:DNA-binding NarL/FixJ family response regulator
MDIKVVVIDALTLFRKGVIAALEAETNIEVVGQGSSATDAIQLLQSNKPDIIVLDLNMQGAGVGLIAKVLAIYPDVKPVVLTSFANSEIVRDVMRAGAWGCVLKGVDGPQFAQILRSIHDGDRYVDPTLAARLFADKLPIQGGAIAELFNDLTRREDQVLRLVAEGLSNKQIGGRLEISEKTVKHYLTIILQKLNVHSRVQAAVLACNTFNRPQRERSMTLC